VIHRSRTGSVVLVLWLLVAAACGSPARTASAAPTTPSAAASVITSPSPPAETPVAIGSATPGAAPSLGSSQAAAAPCTTAQLAISVVDSSAALGTVGAWLRFLNTSRTTCTLHGWPTLIAVTAAGAAAAARQTPGSYLPFPNLNGIPTATLHPGEDAFAAYAGGDNPVGNAKACPPAYRTLRVAPPGSTRFVSLSGYNAWYGQDQPACIGIVVSEIVPASAVPELKPLRP
jgi:hypothetical protein